MIGIIIYSIIFFLFLALAFVFSAGKGAFLIAGYNTLPEEEKAKYNETALAKFMGKIMFGISGSLLLFALGHLFSQNILFIAGLVLFFGLIVFALVYINTGNRFNKNE